MNATYLCDPRNKGRSFLRATIIAIAMLGVPYVLAADDRGDGGGARDGGGGGRGGGAVRAGGGVGRATVAPGAARTTRTAPRQFTDRVERSGAIPQTRYYRGDTSREQFRGNVENRSREGNRFDGNRGNRLGYAPWGWGWGPYAYGRYGYWPYGYYGNGYYDNGYYDNGYYGNGYANQTYAGYGGGFLGVVFDTRYPDAAIISRVYANSPAEAAGLRPGDRIVSINGERIHSPQDVTVIVRERGPGNDVRIRLGGPRSRTVDAVLGTRS